MNMKIISRKEAIKQGLKRYFTGKPCKSGHICERYVDGGCVECRSISCKAWLEAKKQNQPVRRRAKPSKLRLKLDDLKFERELRQLERG